MVFDPCQFTLTNADACPSLMKTWYRIHKSNFLLEFIDETAVDFISNILYQDLDQWAYFSYCKDNCQTPMGYFKQASLDIDPCVKNFNFLLAPNPALTTISLLLELPAEGDFQLWIWDALGRHIDYREFNYPIGKHQHVLDIRHLSAGVYVMKLHRRDGLSWYRTFLVH